MPARSNSFQRLVRAIQGHLSKAGTVTESRFLADRDTGSPVEVDIVIEDAVGGHHVLIGIECTARRRPATIEWYREMLGKHKDLPVSRTVLVSKSGFTKDVREKAKLDNVTLLTLQDAHSFAWRDLLGRLQGGTLGDVSFHLRSLAAEWDVGTNGLPEGLSPDDLRVRASGKELPLSRIAAMAAQYSGFTRGIMEKLGSVLEQTDHATFKFNLPDGVVVTPDGTVVNGLSFEATFVIDPRFKKVNWQPVDFNGKTVATAEVPASFLFPGAAGQTVLTISRDEADRMKLSAVDPSDRDIELETFRNALWPLIATPATASSSPAGGSQPSDDVLPEEGRRP